VTLSGSITSITSITVSRDAQFLQLDRIRISGA